MGNSTSSTPKMSSAVDSAHPLTGAARHALSRARQIAHNKNSLFQGTEHILLALLVPGPIQQQQQQQGAGDISPEELAAPVRLLASAAGSSPADAAAADAKRDSEKLAKMTQVLIDQTAASGAAANPNKYLNYSSPSAARAIQLAVHFAGPQRKVSTAWLLFGLLAVAELDKRPTAASKLVSDWKGVPSAAVFQKLVATLAVPAEALSAQVPPRAAHQFKITADVSIDVDGEVDKNHDWTLNSHSIRIYPDGRMRPHKGATNWIRQRVDIGPVPNTHWVDAELHYQHQQQQQHNHPPADAAAADGKSEPAPVARKGFQILCGRSAGLMSDSELKTLVEGAGVNVFLCLQTCYTEYGCRDYRSKIQEMIKKKEITTVRNGKMRFIHAPIPDFDTVDDMSLLARVQEIQAIIDAPDRSCCVYIHCMGGHGRTGTVIVNLLAALLGVSFSTAMSKLQEMHTRGRKECGGHCALSQGGLETGEQEAQAEHMEKAMKRGHYISKK